MTDYDFPDWWGLATDEQKARWYTEERAFRLACSTGADRD